MKTIPMEVRNCGIGKIEKQMWEMGKSQKEIRVMLKATKRFLKKTCGARKPAPTKSLQFEERKRWLEDEESSVEYGFLPFDWDNDMVKEDVEEWLSENMEIHNYSPYDCTGKLFTKWIDWHVNPDNSISFIHRMGLDI